MKSLITPIRRKDLVAIAVAGAVLAVIYVAAGWYLYSAVWGLLSASFGRQAREMELASEEKGDWPVSERNA